MPKEFTLDIDLNVLNHLGLNLYSNVPAVLAELIANAWDADAARVDVSVEEHGGDKQIVIKDDGCGMDDADLRRKFLIVGYQRRPTASGNLTPKGRPVMGRKGIGKLSVLSIAKKVQVLTKKENADPLGIELEVKQIRKAIETKRKYHPPRIPVPEAIDLGLSGTAIVLSDLKKRVNASLDRYLRQRVARRFSVIGDDFQVLVNGSEITLKDRNYFGKLEYALVYDDFDTAKFKHDEKYIVRREAYVDEQKRQAVRGWIGLVKESGSLQEEKGADNLNKISVLARGKVALEDILDSYREGGLYTKYIIGELEADFLDATEEEDIATSSRQDFIQSDPRFVQLREFVARELKYLANERKKLKDEEGAKRASEIPALKKWYESLKGDTKTAAKKLFGRINQIATDEEHRKTLYKYGVLAFEHLRHIEKLNELPQLDINNIEATVKLFSELDDIEASWYYQITEGRLGIIKKLADHIDEDALEKIIQEHIYTHLWLLDPSWDMATETPYLEQSVIKAFEQVSDKLTEDEKRGRLDIRYKKTTGKHVIIELKRGSVRISGPRLTEQVDKYKRALRKQLREANVNEPIEAVCLVGKELTDWEDSETRQESERALEAKRIRVITYQQLIRDAEASYQQYLEKSKERGRIKKLLDEIEKFDDPPI